MAISTEATVRAVLVAAIRGVASSLGFDEVAGNVRNYPLEMHQEEKIADYLKAQVGGKQVPRCWAVDVRGHDDPFALNQVQRRTYIVRVLAYYAKGEDGQGYLDMIDGARIVRGQFRPLMPTFNNTVTRVASSVELNVVERPGLSVGRLLQGQMSYALTRDNPDF